jgi:phage gp36-like protein
MAYAAREDLEHRYGSTEIEQIEKEAGKSPTSILKALDDAAGEIDAYIGQVYQLPLTTGVKYPLLVWISCDIARYRLWENKVNDETDTVYVRYKRAVKVLLELVAGELALVDEQGNIIEVKNPGIKVISSEKAFTDQVLNAMNYGDT